MTPNPYPRANQAPTIIIKPTPQTSMIRIALACIAALVALLLGLLVLLVIGIETGPVALLVGMITATLPVPVYVVLVLWIDRYESEPVWMLATAFFWGALVAPFFAFLLNTTTGVIVSAITNDLNAGETFAAVISAPIVEESAKAIILFVFFFWKKDEFDGIVDGIVYASLVALGFAMTENIQYYGKAALQGGGGGLGVLFFIRGAMAPFSHPLFTSMTGIGLGLARQTSNLAVKLVTPLIGLAMAIFMHSVWNGSAAIFGGAGFLITYILVMIPAFLILLVVIFLGLRREGQVVRQFLLADLQGGLLTREEYDQLATIRGRMGSSFNALSRGGVKGWRSRMRFNQLASELAFHRSRVSRGALSRENNPRDMEAAYLEALRVLMQEVRPQ
ncbi:MAG: PrsW family intramembrane metalloprotease [Pyrinomonadaceae bacterium]